MKWLRLSCGLTQQKMADLLKIGIRHLQKIEAGDRIPSLELATVASIKTGVSREWVLGDLSLNPILTSDGNPLSKESFQGAQKSTQEGQNFEMLLKLASVQTEAILKSARRMGRGDEALDLMRQDHQQLINTYGLDLEHLLLNGGKPGVGLVGGLVARQEAERVSPNLRGAQLSLLAMDALERWDKKRRRGKIKKTTSLKEFRAELREALETEITVKKKGGEKECGKVTLNVSRVRRFL